MTELPSQAELPYTVPEVTRIYLDEGKVYSVTSVDLESAGHRLFSTVGGRAAVNAVAGFTNEGNILANAVAAAANKATYEGVFGPDGHYVFNPRIAGRQVLLIGTMQPDPNVLTDVVSAIRSQNGTVANMAVLLSSSPETLKSSQAAARSLGVILGSVLVINSRGQITPSKRLAWYE